MTSKILKLVFVTLALLFGATIAPRSADAAAVDMFVKLDGVDGESTDDKHRGWIQAFSVRPESPARRSTRAAAQGPVNSEGASRVQGEPPAR